MLKDALNTLETIVKEISDINLALDQALIVAVTDQRGVITFANEKFCKISKYSREELLGQTHRIVNSGYHSKEFFKDMWRTIASGKIWRGDIRNRAKDGTYYWMDTTIVPCLNEKGKPYQYISFRIDITERKSTEEALLRSEKVAAAGQLASGIAHEVRNPLAAIKMNLQLLEPSKEEDSRRIHMMMSELDRMDAIVGDFLLLAKPYEANFERRTVKSLLDPIVRLMQVQAIGNQMEIRVRYEEQLPDVHCAESQLKQVFVNVIKNALEAMTAGGVLEIDVRRTETRRVRIRFVDQGRGISAESLPHVGEPFYTTKETGTGLGLLMSHKIIKDHGGQLTITSEEGKGTTVDVVLPGVD